MPKQWRHELGFARVPHRRTIDRRLSTLQTEAEAQVAALGREIIARVEPPDSLPVAASIAKTYCSTAYYHIAAETIQMHGGIGFTWEHPAHLYFKRAKSSEFTFGDATYNRELIAQGINL